MPKSHLFTVIMDTYYRPALLKEAVDALFRQTHDNLEIILVNNAATPETVEYLHQVAALDHRVKLVHFEENQHSFDDPHKMLDTCLNAGLRVATGDYIWYQSDDDLIADDYAEKMVALFSSNPECTTAAGLPVSIDVHGNRTDSGQRTSNLRLRYMPGRELALRVARGDRPVFSARGTIFTIRRDVLVKAGGYRRGIELSQLYGIVPFGVTGFDETALFYWRRHEGQLNKKLSARESIGIDETFSMLRDWEIERRWQVFGLAEAREVVSSIQRTTCQSSAIWFIRNLYSWRFGASFRILRRMWRHQYFWLKVSRYAIQRLLLMEPVRRTLKPKIRRAFELWPAMANLSPRFARLRERVNR